MTRHDYPPATAAVDAPALPGADGAPDTHLRGLTAALAAFVSECAQAPLPPAAATATARAFANWIGCVLGAADDPALGAVRRVAIAQGGSPSSSLIGSQHRLDAASAARVNGFAGNALDFDDMHVPTLIHPCATIAPAAFALAEARHVDGRTFIAALAAGIEVTCRLGVALFPAHYDAGWHASATLGTLGAAAAGSVLLGLSPARTAHALGIAATQSSGLRAMLGNECKSFNLGHAAACGVEAALLSEAGLNSAPDVLEARHGLFAVFGASSAAAGAAAIVRQAGHPFLVNEVSLKPYPCGVVIHPLIDACLQLAQAHRLDVSRIRRIELLLHPRALDLAGSRHPTTQLGGRFSVFHAAALAFEYRAGGLAAFDQADVAAPSLHALRERMVAIARPGTEPGAAAVRVELDTGAWLEHAVAQPSGSPAHPLTDAQLRAKFIELTARALEAGAVAPLFDECMDIGQHDDMATVRRHWVRD